MSKRGRFGKYGEIKRLERLRHSGVRSVFKQGLPGGKNSKAHQHFFSGPLTKKIIIRSARLEDLDFIKELSALVFRKYGPYDRTLPRWVDSGSTATFVAEEQGMRVGFAMLGPIFRDRNGQWTAELLAIAVSPVNQGRGIGKRLLEKILETAREHGINRVILHTARNNAIAKKLFSRYGFVAAEKKSGFYHGGQDAVMMSKLMDP